MKRNHYKAAAWMPIGGWLLIMLLVRTGSAEVLVHRNLDELTRQARFIFSGTCTAVTIKSAEVADLGRVNFAEYEFAVSEWIKGRAKEGSFVFRQLRPAGELPFEGSMIPAARSVRAPLIVAPEYAAGQRFVLFLHDEDVFGFTAPVGAVQGVFRSHDDGAGNTVLTNGVGNLGLFRGMSRSHGITRAIAAGELAKEGSAPHAVQRDLFLSMVRDLVINNSAR